MHQISTFNGEGTGISNENEKLNEVLALLKTQTQLWHPQVTQATNLIPSSTLTDISTALRVGNGVRGGCYFCYRPGHRYIHCKKATERVKKAISTRIQTYIDAKRYPQEQIPFNSKVVSPSPPEQRS
jgi:hypothetical protein